MEKTTLSGGMKRQALTIDILASILLVFFLHTLISSYIGILSLKNLLAFYTKNTTSVAWMMIISELAVALLLFIPRTRQIGFSATIVCAAAGTYVVLKNPFFPHDFGGVLNKLSVSQHIVIYSILFTISIAGIFVKLKKQKRKTVSEPPAVIFT